MLGVPGLVSEVLVVLVLVLVELKPEGRKLEWSSVVGVSISSNVSRSARISELVFVVLVLV